MAQPSYAELQAANMANRQRTIATSINMMQAIYAETITNYTPGVGMNRNIPIKNVGLTKRLYITVQANVQQGAAETQTLSKFGPANIFSNITFADYSNYQRINTTGWHLDALATAKRRMPSFSAYSTSNPVATGNIFNVKTAPASVTAAADVFMVYEVPFAYSDTDLTGAILSQVLNANAYLTFTINPNFFVATGANDVQAVYKSSTAQLGKINSLTITIYQDYLDQLPQANGTLLLPAIDLSYVYGIYNTVVSGLAANSDNPYNFTNYRSFLSAFGIYDNAGVLNNGSDVNSWKLQAANMTNIFNLPPWMVKVKERNIIGDDFPLGSYWHDFRDHPISTSINGNMQLLFNPKIVTSNASQLLIGLEYTALLNQVAQAGSVIQ